jgi:cytochrome c553
MAAALVVTTALARQATAPAAPASSARAQPASVQAAPEAAPAPVVALAPDKPATFGDPKAGQAKAGACAACHGLDGNSTDSQYPKLAGQNERSIWRQLKLFKSGERESPIMQPMAMPLSEQDMRDLGAWFATQKTSPGVADDSPVATGVHAGKKYWQVGERLFRAGNAKAGVPACLACHGPAGRGNPGPPYPNVGGQHAAYTSARLQYFRAGGDKARATSPAMVDIAQRLGDEEITALASYMQGLHHAGAAPKAN